MDKRLDLRFEIPRPPCGTVVELSNAEAEKMRLTLLGLKSALYPATFQAWLNA
jgi:hypothetical protein